MSHRLFTVIAAALIATLMGCSSPQLKLYDGARNPAAQAARLTVPEAIEVARINGVEVKGASGMWTRGDKVMELAPGRYELLAYYREIWTQGDQHDVLRSDPALFILDARPGSRYRIDYARPSDYGQAQKLAAAFSGALVDESSGARAASQPSGVRFPTGIMGQIAGASELLPDNGAGSSTQVVAPLDAPPESRAAVTASQPTPAAPETMAPSATVTGQGDWLTLMQAWWKQASAEERRAFLRWVATEH
ncbi:MAG: DUF2057 family protein [Pseudomonadota bacterium]